MVVTCRDEVAEVARWAEGIERVHECISGRRPEPRRRVLDYLRGLLSPVERKNGWQLAEQAGDATPDGVQSLLSTYRWDVNLVRDDLGDYVVKHLACANGVLAADETGFLKSWNRDFLSRLGCRKRFQEPEDSAPGDRVPRHPQGFEQGAALVNNPTAVRGR